MTILLRAATLTNFESVASACGLDARALVAEVGLPPRCLDDPDLLIQATAVARLLELAAKRGNEPAFGLRMAAARRLSNLGPLGLLVRDQPTLRHALGALVRHMHLHNEAFSVTLEEGDGLVTIREETEIEGGGATRQAIELGMATTFRLLAIFLGENWRPRLVSFRHPAPRDLRWHQRIFGPALAFGEEINGIVCNAADLDAPNPGADPVMARYTRLLLEADHGKHPPMSDRVRRLAVLLLPRGHCRVETVARHLGVDRRTVANHLSAEHTTFSALVDGMRCDLLERYLKEGSRPLSEVSALLGFSEPSSFSRWHRRHFGGPARDRLDPRRGAAPRRPMPKAQADRIGR